MSWPAPTRAHHVEFCRIEGWTELRRAVGKRGGHHHLTYELPLSDGRLLRTRVSHPPDKKHTYGASLWAHILRDQLDVDEAAFWDCVQRRVVPARAEPPFMQRGIPADLYRLLTGRAGMLDSEVRSMNREQAIAAAAAFWSRGGPSDRPSQGPA